VPRPQTFVSRYRWVICALLFFATTINYIDRAVLGVLAPLLRDELAWSDQDYGRISAAFTLAYALGFLVAGLAYLAAILVMHLLAPKLEVVGIDTDARGARAVA